MDGILLKEIHINSIKLEKHNIHSEVTCQFHLLKNALLSSKTPVKEETKLLYLVRALYSEILNFQNASVTKQKLYNQILTHSSSSKNQIFNYIEHLSEDAKAFIQKRREHQQQLPLRSQKQRSDSPIPSSSSPKIPSRPLSRSGSWWV